VKSKFIRCINGCLKCDKADECIECPIDKFTLQKQVVVNSSKGENIFSGILGLFFGFALPFPKISVTEIRIINECLDKCPEKYGDEELPVIIHEAERKCIVKASDHSSSNTSLPALTDDNDIPKYIAKLKMTYDEAIKSVEKNSSNAQRPGLSKECHYNGIIKKEIRGDLDSYYICRCEPGYMGDNCQISKKLYDDIQVKITKILSNVQSKYTKLDKKSRDSLLDILVSLNKFKVSRPTLEQIISMVQTYVHKDKQLENKKKLYLLYDSLLLNLFDLREDLRKRPAEESLYIKDIDDEMNAIYDDINHVLLMLEDSLEDLNFANSFLDRNSKHYIGLETYSYILSEYRYSNYEPNQGFMVANPNIDTSFNNVNNNFIYFTFKDESQMKTSKYNIQALNIAAPLFTQKMKLNRRDTTTKQTLISNIVFIRNIDPDKPHLKLKMNDLGIFYIRIKMSMNFIPFVDLQKHHLNCIGYSVTPGVLNLEGECVSFDDDAEEADCVFAYTGEIEGYYFGLEVNI